MTAPVLALLAFCILAEIATQLSFKVASNGAQSAKHHVFGLAMQPLLWVGIIIWAIEVVAWVLVLQRAPLDIAYPIMMLNYAGVPLAGALALKESITRSQAAGATLVAVGVICVALSGT